MLRTCFPLIGALAIACGISLAQTPANTRVLGTVEAIRADASEMDVMPDKSDAAVLVKYNADTVVLRIAPGEKDLKKAETIALAAVAKGDHVLVSLMPDAPLARRIIVMAATDIAKRNEADRLDWTKRGIAGVVSAKKDNEITLKKRSFQGEVVLTVVVGDTTAYRQYAPDSVKFAEAKSSALANVNVGDQLRARGTKSEDGLKVTADEVVFGTFQTKAGSITAVNVETKEITVKDLSTNKPLTIRLTADSQLKKMPNFGGLGGAPGAGGGGAWAGAPARSAPGATGAARSGGGPDFAQMLEHMPPVKLEDLKPGDTIVVSSTKGAKPGQITAIMLLTNADMIIQMAAMQAGGSGGAGGAGGRQAMMGGGGGGMPGMGGGGLGGFDMSGMTP